MRYMMRLLLLFSVLISQQTFAMSAADAEKAIFDYYTRLSKSTSDEQSDSLSNEIRKTFIAAFEDPATFDHAFESLQMCKLISSDRRIRLFNWNQPYQDGRHKFYCFVLVKEKKKETFQWTELIDDERETEKIENKFLSPDKWFGALYYEIIPMDKKGRGDTYTLLGWDGKDNLTTRKLIDAISIVGKKIRIGAAIFDSEAGVRKRYILEYSNEVSASVKYYPKKQCIVMDHLSPKNPVMTGIFADYGPDGSYHLFMMKKGKWEYIDNIDITEFADDNDKPFFDPRPRRKR
jgi:hypothetical protein